MKTYKGIEYLILALDQGYWSDSSPGRFTPRKGLRYALDRRRLGGPQSRSGLDGEEKNSLPCRTSNPGRSAHNL